MMVNNNANARALSACAELNLGALRQGNLGEVEGTVEAGKVSLGHLLTINPGLDLLPPEPLKTGYLLSLRGMVLVDDLSNHPTP